MNSLSSADMIRMMFLERELDLISSKFSRKEFPASYEEAQIQQVADETYHFVSGYIREELEELKKLNE